MLPPLPQFFFDLSHFARQSRITRWSKNLSPKLSQCTDEELMDFYIHGDERAFELLYERHADRVYGFIKKKTKSAAEADEIFQEVFLKLHKSKGTFQKGFQFLPWIYTITKHVMIDRYRKTDQVYSYAEDESALDKISTPNIEYSGSSNIDKILEFSENLPEQARIAIMLRFFEDKSFQDIAKSLNTTPENVRQLVSRGLSKIKFAFQKRSSS